MAFTEIAALWKNRSGNGFSGKLTGEVPVGERIFLFENTRKKTDRDPDYRLYIGSDEQQKPQQPAEKPEEGVPF